MDLRSLLAALSTSVGVASIEGEVGVVTADDVVTGTGGVLGDAGIRGGGVPGVGVEDDPGAGLCDLLSVSARALCDAWTKLSRSLLLRSGDISMALTVAWSWDTSWVWALDSLDLCERPLPPVAPGLAPPSEDLRACLMAAW